MDLVLECYRCSDVKGMVDTVGCKGFGLRAEVRMQTQGEVSIMV